MAKTKSSVPFGNLVGLKPININVLTTSANDKEINNNTKKYQVPKIKMRTMKISEELFQRLKSHSRRNYNIEPYETIISNLLDYYDKNNEPDFRYTHLSRI